jgi:hypothetical protein
MALYRPEPKRDDLKGYEKAVSDLFGCDADGNLTCPLPGHRGKARIGIPDDDPDGPPRLLCCRGQWRSLGLVRAAISYGDTKARSNFEIAMWTQRLAYEVGALEVRPSPGVPSLPDGASAVARASFNGFVLLLALRTERKYHAAYSIRFNAAWAGLSYRESALGLEELKNTGMMLFAGRVGGIDLFALGNQGVPIPVEVVGEAALRTKQPVEELIQEGLVDEAAVEDGVLNRIGAAEGDAGVVGAPYGASDVSGHTRTISGEPDENLLAEARSLLGGAWREI